MATRRKTRRHVLLATLAGLGCGTAVYGFAEQTNWKTYEAVEEAWIRDRYALLVQQAPAAIHAAAIDLEIKLADLKKRALEFQYLVKTEGIHHVSVWQLGAPQLPPARLIELQRGSTAYRKYEERIRQMADMLRHHPQYEMFRRAQMRLWKTPEYRDAHRRYMGRLQDLHTMDSYDESLPQGTIANQ